MKYWTFYAIWVWCLLATSAMYLYFTDSTAWGAPVIYIFLLVMHAANYHYQVSLSNKLCCCGHSKEAHSASIRNWDKAQELSRLGDTRYVNYHEGCQCLTYVPTIRKVSERHAI